MLLRVFGVLCASALLAEPVRGDWPMFRANALQTGVADSRLPKRLEVRWKVRLGDAVEGAAAIAGGVTYVGSFDGHLYAFGLKDGKQRWKYKMGPTKAPPSVRGGLVFIGDEDGVFHCVDARSGKKKWTYDAEGEISSGANFFGNRILFCCHDGHLYCLQSDGKLDWKFETQGPVYGSPVIADAKTFVAGCDSALHTVDARTGKSLSKVELSGQTGASPAAVGGMLYIGNMSNQVQAIDIKRNRIVWSYEREARAQAFFASAAVTDKYVVIGSRDRSIHAVHRKTGKKSWLFPTRGRVDSSPVIAGGRVYAASLDGKLYVVDLQKGTKIQSISLGEAIAASPAVADGCLVIGTGDGWLYCLGSKRAKGKTN